MNGVWHRSLLLSLAVLLSMPAQAIQPPGEAAGGGVKIMRTPFLRVNNALNHMRVDPKGHFIAYEGDDGHGLWIADIKSKNIFRVADGTIGAAFFWSPDGYRLIYRQQTRQPNGGIVSEVRAYDCALARSVTLDSMPFATGYLTFDPRDLRLQLLGPKGIRTKRIYFPDERLARWQIAQRRDIGKWLATQKGMLWVTQGGYAMRLMTDDGSGLESFDVAPDGSMVAWATAAGHVYTAKDGETPALIGPGRDPRWHPEKAQLVYAGGRVVGQTIIGYDLRLADLHGAGRFLTSTQYTDERWPQWHPNGRQLIFTVAKTTDVYLMDLVQ